MSDTIEVLLNMGRTSWHSLRPLQYRAYVAKPLGPSLCTRRSRMHKGPAAVKILAGAASATGGPQVGRK